MPPLIPAARLLLAPAFGLAMALCLVIVWLMFGRAWTPDSLVASLYLGAAGTISAGVALAAAALLLDRPMTARLSAAFVILVVGSVGLTSVFLMTKQVSAAHNITELPLGRAVLVVTISSAAALYNFLTVLGLVILPLGLPVIAVFALLIARKPR
jgi:hypothetical protein